MKKLLLLPLLFLAGCQSTQPMLRTTEQVVVMPDRSLFKCPTLDKLPNPDTLTDLEVARVLVELQKNNKVCKNNIVAIEKFLVRAQKTVEQPVEQSNSLF